MHLSGRQRKQLQEALVSAFPTKASLEQMLSFGFNENLDKIAGGKDLQEIVFNLIITAEAEGWIEKLISAARKSNPGNSSLKAIAQELLTEQTEDSNQGFTILPQNSSANPKEFSHKNQRVSFPEIQNPKPVEIVPLSEIPVTGDSASEVKANYTKLREFLKERRFDKADDETAKIMLWVAKREDDGWLREEDLKKFPHRDLCTIDKLWLASSNGQFGFSIQKQIWINLGGKPEEYDYESFHSFLRSVEWDSESKITFDARAKKGHLPLGLYVKTSDNARLHQKWSALMDKYDPKAREEESRRWEEHLRRKREMSELRAVVEATEREILILKQNRKILIISTIILLIILFSVLNVMPTKNIYFYFLMVGVVTMLVVLGYKIVKSQSKIKKFSAQKNAGNFVNSYSDESNKHILDESNKHIQIIYVRCSYVALLSRRDL